MVESLASKTSIKFSSLKFEDLKDIDNIIEDDSPFKIQCGKLILSLISQ